MALPNLALCLSLCICVLCCAQEYSQGNLTPKLRLTKRLTVLYHFPATLQWCFSSKQGMRLLMRVTARLFSTGFLKPLASLQRNLSFYGSMEVYVLVINILSIRLNYFIIYSPVVAAGNCFLDQRAIYCMWCCFSGPGCSSIAYGKAQELGPFWVKEGPT